MRSRKRAREPQADHPAHAAQSPGYLAIALIAAPRGVGGELKAEILSDFPDRFPKLKQVFLGHEYEPYGVESARVHRRSALFKLRGVDTVEQAEALRGKLVHVRASEAARLGEDEYFWHQIIDLEVQTTGGEVIGRVADILRTGANDVYVVRDGKQEILIPAIEDVVKEIDLAQGRMIVEPMPGMVE